MIYYNQPPASRLTRYSLFSIFFVALLLFSCQNEKKADEKAEDTKPFKNIQESQQDSSMNLKRENSNFEGIQDTLKHMKSLRIVTGEIDSTFFENAKREFPRRFSKTPSLNYNDIIIPLPNKILTDLFNKYPTSKKSGLVFHYGLAADSKSLVYIISDGKTDQVSKNISFKPFDITLKNSTAQKFVLIQNSQTEPVTYIDKKQMCALTTRYCAQMENHPISSAQGKIDCDVNAQLVYHEGLELHEFLKYYKDFPYLQLYISHGAAIPINGKDIEHVPLFTFGDVKSRFPLDNKPRTGGSPKYMNKGLDAGQLCPPHCAENPQEFCKSN